MTKITQEDWQKLYDFAKSAAGSARKSIPSDWNLSVEEITSVALGVVCRLVQQYEDGAMEVTSYVWMYLEKTLVRDLLREYRRLKKQLDIIELQTVEDEEGNVRRQYGQGDVEKLSVNPTDEMDAGITAREMLDHATPEDRRIMEMIIEGRSYDEIAAAVGCDKKAITRRMKKYRRDAE